MRCGVAIAYVFCLACFFSTSGYAWRWWHFERRGIESSGRGAARARGMGVNVELTRYDADQLDTVLDDVSALGMDHIRQRFRWQDIEPQAGVYDWAMWDRLVDAAQRHGLRLIAVLDTPPDWAVRHSPVPLPCVPPVDEAAFARFVGQVAGRYANRLDGYQVWDEPNLSRYWGNGHVSACGYVTLLQAAYGAIHAADPTAWVLGGGLAPTQSPGPTDLNDLVYLRQLYALGAESFWDVLAVKPYGFWSGPDDRRVAADTLNFSRLVAVRELARAQGPAEAAKPIWAVEWGWNLRRADEVAPWGGDAAAVQTERIRVAMARVDAEWPWLGLLCWAVYQPDSTPDDPRWSFALRDASGQKTALYDALQNTKSIRGHTAAPIRWIGLVCGLLLWGAGLLWPWLDRRWRDAARSEWHKWAGQPAWFHGAVLAGLSGLYAWTPHPEWMLLSWALSLSVFAVHSRWAAMLAVWSIPLFYGGKPLGSDLVTPAEPFLLAAVVGLICDVARRKFKVVSVQIRWLDGLWGMWVLVGLIALFRSPDRWLAWREWRLCFVQPALLYGLIRLERRLAWRDVLWAWLASGVTVSLVGVGQWCVGAVTWAGEMGRVSGVYYSPNHLALYLERLVPVAVGLAWRADRRRLAWGGVGILLLVLYLTGSRGAWLLGVPAAWLVMGWTLRPGWRGRLIGIGLCLLLAWSGIAAGRGLNAWEQEIRVPVWRSALALIADHPWSGVGLDGFQFAYPRYLRAEAWSEPLLYHPHNMWLDAAARLGLPGLAVFVALIGCSCKLLWAGNGWQGRRRVVQVGLCAGLCAGLAHGLVDSGYFLPDLACGLALMVGVGMELHRQSTSNLPEIGV